LLWNVSIGCGGCSGIVAGLICTGGGSGSIFVVGDCVGKIAWIKVEIQILWPIGFGGLLKHLVAVMVLV